MDMLRAVDITIPPEDLRLKMYGLHTLLLLKWRRPGCRCFVS